MTEWLQSIWGYIVENKDTILGILTSGTLAGIIGLIVAFIKLFAATKSSKKDVSEIKSLLTSVKTLVETTKKLEEEQLAQKEVISIALTHLESLGNTVTVTDNEVQEKLTGIVDILQAAFSTIRSDTARDNINNIVTNIKYGSAKRREELLQKLADLKKVVEDASTNTNDTVTKVLEEATEIVTNTVNSNVGIRRY